MKKSILVIPDCQIKPGEDLAFLHCIGKYIIAKKPDIVVNMGDFWDMSSLSSYDKGKKSAEGKRYLNDIEAGKTGNKILWSPTKEYNLSQLKRKLPIYRPKMEFLMGNHEDRARREVEENPLLEGLISDKNFGLEEMGWKVHPFLKVVVIQGIAFSHYFTSGIMGRACTSAKALINNQHMSCVAGHQQGLQIATGKRADGATLTSIIAGSAYTHDESYLGFQGNKHWRGIIMLHNCDDGQFDPVFIPTKYLLEKYNPKGKKFYTCPD